MGGGLVQLVAYGAQDIYLTSNPQITFFKVVYRRHTNFAMESIEQTFNGNVALGNRVTATISRNGDLIKDMWLEVDLSASADLTDAVYGVGNAMVKQVELEIGGQLIDRQYGEWMNIWSELTVPEGKRAVYDEMVGNHDGFATGAATTTPTTDPKAKLDVPLMFWFNRNPGLALPLIALQYHEVKLNLELSSNAELATTTSTSDVALTSCKLWVDYIFLDTDERRRFAQVSHEYLIEQVQFTGDETLTSGGARMDLNYNHPVKELIWVHQTSAQARGSTANTSPCQFTAMDFTSAKLQLNGHDRFTERRPEYFLNVQPFKHHTHGPRADRTLALDASGAVSQRNAQYIYVYSFALNPEELQPSGTCNFSRIDNATLVLTGGTSAGIAKVFAVNYNVLRIMSGMGGLAYSN
jgi:hypothetical protein